MFITKHVEIVRLRPGDIVVYRYAGKLSPEVADRVRDRLKQKITGNEVMILDSGASLSVLRGKEAK